MVGKMVFCHPDGQQGERVGFVVEQQPRTKLWVVAYEYVAGKYRHARVETVEPLQYPSEAQEVAAIRRWSKRARSRDAAIHPSLREMIRKVTP